MAFSPSEWNVLERHYSPGSCAHTGSKCDRRCTVSTPGVMMELSYRCQAMALNLLYDPVWQNDTQLRALTDALRHVYVTPQCLRQFLLSGPAVTISTPGRGSCWRGTGPKRASPTATPLMDSVCDKTKVKNRRRSKAAATGASTEGGPAAKCAKLTVPPPCAAVEDGQPRRRLPPVEAAFGDSYFPQSRLPGGTDEDGQLPVALRLHLSGSRSPRSG